MKNDSAKKIEFTLSLNDKIICKRNFKVNKFDEIRDPHKLKEMFSQMIMTIENHLKKSTLKTLWSSYDSFKPQIMRHNFSKIEKEDIFRLDVNLDYVIISGIFKGNCYSPNIRYKVDIRPIISTLIQTVRGY